MRAGTLSDPRVLALLRRHFVCVHMPELLTRDLIAEARDRDLLEAYDREARNRLLPGFHGGEREAFLAPDGTLVDVFLSLNTGAKEERQYTVAARAQPAAGVDRFFAAAGQALRRTAAGVPRDLAALRDGTHAEVAGAAALAAVEPEPPDALRQHVRVHVRNDLPMYEGLVAGSWLSLAAAEARAMLPARPAAGATAIWPDATVRSLARAAYPRGAGVLLALADDSIEGEVTTSVAAIEGDIARGTFTGRIAMAAPSAAERGRRESYRPFRGVRFALRGDFDFDLRAGCFLSLRLASECGELRCVRGGNEELLAYSMGAELRR